MKFRKKPVTIEAIQFQGNVESYLDIVAWAEASGLANYEAFSYRTPIMTIPTLEGAMSASAGDWIIKGVKGEFYPCKPDIFEATYEPAEGETE